MPNPFWGGVLFPLVVFVVLCLWPCARTPRRPATTRFHNLLDRPRDNPRRTALGAAFLTWVFLVFLAGSADRVDVSARASATRRRSGCTASLVWVVPVAVYFMVRRVCSELVTWERVRPRPR